MGSVLYLPSPWVVFNPVFFRVYIYKNECASIQICHILTQLLHPQSKQLHPSNYNPSPNYFNIAMASLSNLKPFLHHPIPSSPQPICLHIPPLLHSPSQDIVHQWLAMSRACQETLTNCVRQLSHSSQAGSWACRSLTYWKVEPYSPLEHTERHRWWQNSLSKCRGPSWL